MPEVLGNTTGLAPSSLKALERVLRRRVPLDKIATSELIRSLAEASRESKRQVGALVHRSGQVDSVVVGSPTGLLLPDIGRLRQAQGRQAEAQTLLSEIYNWFSEGFDTVDLKEAKALLDELQAVASPI